MVVLYLAVPCKTCTFLKCKEPTQKLRNVNKDLCQKAKELADVNYNTALRN